MIRKAAYALFGLIFLVISGNASARPCSSVHDGSCWSTTNYGSQPVDIYCRTESWTLISLTALPPGAQDTTQFDTGYGDGLGFPEPGIAISCAARLSNGQRAQLAFRSHGWGDRVAIRVERDQLIVTSTEYWHRVLPHVVTAEFSGQ